jgi:hypothetical protein
VSQWLSAQTTPSGRRLQQIAAALNVTVDALRRAPIRTDQQSERRVLHLRRYPIGGTSDVVGDDGEWTVPADEFRGIASDQPDLVTIRVVGINLEPELRPGDLVVVDRHWQVVSAAGVYLAGDERFPSLCRCEPLLGSERQSVIVHGLNGKREVAADILLVVGRVICKLLVPL